MKTYAARLGGYCLSDIYINNHTHLLWRCTKGHEWKARPSNVVKGHWCGSCAIKTNGFKRRSSIQKMQELATKKGGECLSDAYFNNSTKLLWKCAKGHEWLAQPSNIQQGKWCPHCLGRMKTISDMKALAEKQGGKCLSDVYTNRKDKLLWCCAEGHEWRARVAHVWQGSWCPICSQGLRESICRAVLERAFGKKFNKSRPKWLKNREEQGLELDGFSSDLGLAFEHNGMQHYQFIPFYHRDHQTFIKRKRDDEDKRRICIENGINLVVIPYNVKETEIAGYIFNACLSFGYEVKKLDFIWLPEDVYHSRAKKIELLKQIAREKGGECLSMAYINNNHKLKWVCGRGHVWEAAPHNIQAGTWCPHCSKSGKVHQKTIEEMKLIAAQKGGLCLSDSYKNLNSKLLWQCSKGHTWNRAPSGILTGAWCPRCRLAANEIENLQNVAISRGGELLSKKYINSDTKLRWRCHKNHEWDATAGHVRSGRWCPLCIGRGKTIEDMRKVAHARGGQCLTAVYLGIESRMDWECALGHKWTASAASVFHSSWCPKCANDRKRNKFKYTIQDVQEWANKLGGNCLSPKFLGKDTKLIWTCAEGHEWTAVPNSVRQGHWCPVCARTRRKTVKIQTHF